MTTYRIAVQDRGELRVFWFRLAVTVRPGATIPVGAAETRPTDWGQGGHVVLSPIFQPAKVAEHRLRAIALGGDVRESQPVLNSSKGHTHPNPFKEPQS